MLGMSQPSTKTGRACWSKWEVDYRSGNGHLGGFFSGTGCTGCCRVFCIHLKGGFDTLREKDSHLKATVCAEVPFLLLFCFWWKCLKLLDTSDFYKAVFKTSNLFKWKRLEPTSALHWLMEVPLIDGARMDVQDNITSGLNSMLRITGAVTLRRIVDVAGSGLAYASVVAAPLGWRSI